MNANPIYQCARTKSPITVSNDMSQFDGLPKISIRDRSQLTGAEKWKGVDDLSATARLLFDNNCLYLLVGVMDNDLQWPKSAGEGMWNFDSIQVAFDPELDGGVAGTYSGNQSEYTISLVDNKPVVWRERAPNGKLVGLVASVTAHLSPYHPAFPGWYVMVAFPWTEIGLNKIEEGVVFGMDILVNDRDAGRDRIFMQWTPGIGAAKTPSSFGRVHLVAKAEANAQDGEIDEMHPESWAEKWIKLDGTADPAAVQGTTRYLPGPDNEGTIYCWWILGKKLLPGTYRAYARVKGKGTFTLCFQGVVDAKPLLHKSTVAVNTSSFVLYDLGIFEYSEPCDLKVSDWSTKGLSVDYVALRSESEITKGLVKEKANDIRRQAAELDKELQAAEKSGLDVMNQRITYNTAVMFAEYGREDVEHNKFKRGEKVFDFLEMAVPRAIAEVKLKVANASPAAAAPLDLSNLHWKRGHFYSGESPVFLYGALGMTPEITKKLGLNCGYSFYPLFNLITDDSGNVDQSGLSRMSKEVKAYRAVGLPMIYQIATHYFPQSIIDKYPETRHVGQAVSVINHCLESPVTLKVYSSFFEKALPVLAGDKLLALELANELGYACKCDYTLAEFRKYLAAEYGSVERLSAAWGKQIKNFDEAPFSDDQAKGAAKYDWCDFNQRRTLKIFGRFNEQSHKAAPNVATSIKIVTGRGLMSEADVKWGLDHEMLAQLCTWTGEDSYFAESGTLRALIYDWYRSLSGGRPIVDTECPFIRPGTTAEGVRFNTWIGAVHGEAGAMHFVWDRGETMPEFEDLISTQPWAVESLGRTAHEVNRVAATLVDLANAPSPFRILYSRSSSIVSPERHLPELVDCYQALMFAGTPISFVTERQLAGGDLAGVKAILVPQVDNIPEDALRGLARFTADGGTLIFSGTPTLNTERNFRREEQALQGLKVDPAQSKSYGKGHLIGLPPSKSREERLAGFGKIMDSLKMDRCPGAQLNLEARRVWTGGSEIRVYLNYGEKPLAVSLPKGAFDILRQNTCEESLTVPPMGIALIKID